MNIRWIIGFCSYTLCFKYLPKSVTPVFGTLSSLLRRLSVFLIFKKVGVNVNVENLAYFGHGKNIEIGNYSGIGKRCRIPSNIIIGDHVMMGEDVLILNSNHDFSRMDIPMSKQGHSSKSQLVIDNDVWIGARAIILPQVTSIGTGVIIGSGAVVTKNISDYSVVGGNPARILKCRK